MDGTRASTQGGVGPKFCPNCGTKIDGGPNFCPNCGTSLTNFITAEDSGLSGKAGEPAGMTFASDSAGITTEKVEGEAVLRDRSLAKEDTGGGSESVQMDGAGRRERSRTESESQDEVGQAETPERKHGGGVLKVALIAAVVVFGLAILGMIVGRGGSHDATIMGETEPMNPFINENGYPNLPAVVEATLSDQWVIGDDENGDSGFVHDIGLEPAEDGDGYGTVKQSYLGFEKYKLDVIDLPDEGEDGVNVVNFMYHLKREHLRER